MKLVKVSQSFYELIKKNHVEEEIMFNEQGRPCVLLVDLEYKGSFRKFVIPLRSNISPRTPRGQYFSLPPNRNTRAGYHHGVHYIKLFPIENKYVDRYRVGGSFFETIIRILTRNEAEIVSACRQYLRKCEEGNKHSMTPDIDGIIRVLESSEVDEELPALETSNSQRIMLSIKKYNSNNIKQPVCFRTDTYSEKLKKIKLRNRLR